jgi:hypothetical protein
MGLPDPNMKMTSDKPTKRRTAVPIISDTYKRQWAKKSL